MTEANPGADTSTPNQPASPRTITVYAPATGAPLGEVPVHSPAEVRQAVERARVAQRAWGQVPLAERAARVARIGELFLDRADELVDVLVREGGKPRVEALTHEVTVTVDLCHYYTRHATRILADQPIELHLLKHRRSYITYVPMGVIGVIAPWNFPLVIPMGSVIEALIAGNGVVLKPSEYTPLIALKAREIALAAGIPADLFQVVTGDGSTGAALVDAGVQKVIFTGAVATGRRVGAACGERLIPCVLELGGKAPLIACEDCDIERTAQAIVYGGFANAGQVCISVERVLAHEAVHDRLLDRVVDLTRALRQGDPAEREVDVGAIIFPRQIDVAEAHVRDAIAKGAVVLTGGQRRPGPGNFFEPTILANCRPDMTVMREEIFGPIVPFMKVRDEEEAIRLANDSHLGLNAYVFSRDRERAREIAERIEAGTVMVNDVLSAYGAMEAPFGGIKASGYGRVHSDDSLRGMCYARHINYDRVPMPARMPFYYPYSEGMYRTMLTAARALFGRHGFLGRLADLF
jgi:succinate-semialdehyde dehydrogenase/glutarate-semialdehyde dehydrogenase